MSEPLEIAVLIDGAFIDKLLKSALSRDTYPTADHFVNFALACIIPAEERLLRIFFYDSFPCGGSEMHPMTRQKGDFMNALYRYRVGLLKRLAEKDYLALRRGNIKFNGWKLSSRAV